MIYKVEKSLSEFEFWSGACIITDKLTVAEFDEIEANLSDIFENIPTDTEINDMFWFEPEFVLNLIGLNVDEVLNRE